MIVFTVSIKSFTVRKDDKEKKFFPLVRPKPDTEILVSVNDDFPSAFAYWVIKPISFVNKTKTASFRTISKMFQYFTDNNIDVGASLSYFYKIKKEIPKEPPLEGVEIYTYRNISIRVSTVG